jgi:hypothetical protein
MSIARKARTEPHDNLRACPKNLELYSEFSGEMTIGGDQTRRVSRTRPSLGSGGRRSRSGALTLMSSQAQLRSRSLGSHEF